MRIEYAPRGLIGVLTPQANTTVEPEFWVMLPPGMAMINARMVSQQDSLEARLVHYWDHLGDAIAQFANAPLDAIALATTGTSYMAGAAREAEAVSAIRSKFGAPLVTAGQAVVLALRTLGAKAIGLVSPYPESLTRKAEVYWAEQGFTIGSMVQIGTRTDTFHPIYSISAAGAEAALAEFEGKTLDAIVMLGTGMPTLSAVTARPRVGDAVVLSCMLCLGWAAIDAATHQTPNADALAAFAGGAGWKARLSARSVV